MNIIFKIQRFFAKENVGCKFCKWVRVENKDKVLGDFDPVGCYSKNNKKIKKVFGWFDGSKTKFTIHKYIPYELNKNLKCPWFKYKVDPSLYGNGKIEEDLKRAFVFSEPKKSKKRGKKK
jgi:hypothetical protein